MEESEIGVICNCGSLLMALPRKMLAAHPWDVVYEPYRAWGRPLPKMLFSRP